HWLTYLAATFLSTSHVGVGGPNIAPAGDGPIAECVARAPGGPVHVLVTDREAEHIPGCNMAFRTAFLEAVGGFDSRFRSAGADSAGLPAADARVASDDRDTRGDRDVERRLEPVAPGTAALSRRDRAVGGPGVPRGRPRAIPRCPQREGAAGAPRPDRGTALHSAHRAAARSHSRGPHPVAAPLPAAAGAPLARHGRRLE